MPTVSAILKAVQHPIRRQILDVLNQNISPVEYSRLLHLTEESTGKLNYHLKILGDILEKKNEGYLLSIKGKNILNWLHHLIDEGEAMETDRPSVVIEKLTPMSSLRTNYQLQSLIIYTIVAIVHLVLSYLIVGRIKFGILGWIFLGTEMLVLWFISMYCNQITYNITDTEVEVFKGVITHTTKIVPYRTITNVEVKQGPFDRLFNMQTVEISTAGKTAHGPEERLVGMANGLEIKETILERMRLLNPPDFMANVSVPENNVVPILQELQSLNQVISTSKENRES
ncbi:MAG: PH domain-containing protein [Candidatus Heimdallarchaeota archaeon]|nr:PH domain-containing protein [Candidatus Heimdallarchaeota archaeon]